MKNYFIRLYTSKDKAIWNTFIGNSKNGTFLFNRDFMEYHQDRFQDYSLLIFDEKQKLLSVLPANRVDSTVYSHQGLTFGGLIFDRDLGAETVEAIFLELIHFFNTVTIEMFVMKQVPILYHQNPSNEMDYFLFKNEAKLIRRDMNLAIDFSKPIPISKSKLKHFRRISDLAIRMEETQDLEAFWNQVLLPRLEKKHHVKPVHTMDEIHKLKALFPDNIKQFNAYVEEELVAGITLFCSKTVVKSQYGATTELGEKWRALDFLFLNLITEYQSKVAYFDMGIVNENNGKIYNKGLLKQKEELGCRIFSHDYYEIDIAKCLHLNQDVV